ncbi:MAG: twin-arginine translocase TatA/TatE family subunit [Ignavibacteriaceae bacterium]|nr:twin-arginine translocase TatA/TatE family subunit [Ignavibacteriaceae bacterium]
MLAFIGNLGAGEIILILLVVLLLFGAKKIPELAQGLGKGMKEFKKSLKDVEDELKKTDEEIKKTDEKK